LIKTGLFFGSYNPVHIGHLIIAGYMQQFTDVDEVWFVVSPQNPLKEKTSLEKDHQRLLMVQQAIEDDPRLSVTDVEFSMPRPSFTIDTLGRLTQLYPDRNFLLIAGSDIFDEFHKWKDHKKLLDDFSFYIYNRPGYDAGKYASISSVKVFQAPLLEISSTFIRQAIKDGKDVRYMLPAKVWKYIGEQGLYK
jgi:nicotinate-nucleotide adenylyltransferase